MGYGKDLAFILRAMRRHSGVKQGTGRTDLVLKKQKTLLTGLKTDIAERRDKSGCV